MPANSDLAPKYRCSRPPPDRCHTLYRAQGRTWTDRFNEKFQAAHGFSPTAYYPALWYDIGPATQAARNYLFGFRSEMYATGFVKTIQDWCTAHGGVPLLGHQDQENVKNPVGVSGDLMKSYRYIHRVKDGTDVYFFANLGGKQTDATVRLRGKFTPETWDPHTGEFSVPEFTHAVENGQPVTRVKVTLGPVRS